MDTVAMTWGLHLWSSASAPLLIAAVCTLTSCTLLDHPTDAGLQRELIERSKQGLGLARFSKSSADIDLRFFDGREVVLNLACCPPVQERTISRNRLVMVDMTHAPILDPLRDPGLLATLQLYGGPVVKLDTRGRLIAYSKVLFQPAVVSLSHNEERFAIAGVPGGHPIADAGVYVAGFQGGEAHKLMNLTFPAPQRGHFRTQMTLDWSTHDDNLLFSYNGSISLLDPRSGRAKKITEGHSALWSPSGKWISYITANFDPALLNVSTGESKLIDPHKHTGSPLEWSPDGAYLLIPESEGSHVPYGCLWVYRVSDGAFVPIPNYGIAGPAPHWIQIEGPNGLKTR
jgi:WD40 repeat protein